MIEKLEVGQPYRGNIIQEGTKFDYGESGFTLIYFLPNITKQEEESFRTGKYKFALVEKSGIMFFLSEFKPGIDLSDTPFHFSLYNDDRITLLPKQIEDGQGLSLTVIAVDSSSGILKSLRQIGLPTKFSRKLIDICVKQSKKIIDRSEFDVELFNVQRSYQAKDLLRFATMTCKG